MKRCSQTAAALLCAVLLALAWAAPARAQVTTSSLAGTVTGPQGEPVPGVQITATNTRTGAVYRAVTRADGRYALQGMQPGGPYRVQASGLGWAPSTRPDVSVALGQTETVNFQLAAQAVALEGIVATAEDAGAVISPTRTGASTTISDSAITRLPTITRDFTDFTRLVPQLSTSGGGTVAGGRNNRFNNIQIDGAVNNDLFGLAASGTPGGQAGTKPITLEAIQEFVVVLAPFDVRQGGFTGAGINAITRSGGNRWSGTAALYGRNESFVGNFRLPTGNGTTESADFGEFKQTEAAFSLGGPIVRDRAFLFAAGEISRRNAPNGVFPGRGATVPQVKLDSIIDVLSDQYGYDPGTSAEIDTRRESNNLFGRLDFNLGANNRLTVRHNYVDAFDDNFTRSDAAYQLGNAGYVFNSTTHASVAQLNSTFGNQIFNELRIGYTTVRDNRELPSDPFPRVEVDVAGCAGTNCRIVAGAENFSIANELDQDVLEITDDVSFSRGIHNIVIGTHNEFFSFSNLFARNLYGLYRFANIDSLRTGGANRYEFSFFNEGTPGAKERAEFSVQQFSLYAQDRVSLSDRFNFTAGVRLDMTRFPDKPGRNPLFEAAFAALGRRTDEVPDNVLQFNPRVGFNWDVQGDQTTQVRGGVGLFSGRTPYVWVSNAYGNTGLDYTRFTCDGSGGNLAPRFVSDPNNQPQSCVDAAGNPRPISAVPNEINLIDPDFKLPQVIRGSLAVDRELAWGLIGTLEGLYTKSVNDPVYRDLTVTGTTGATIEGRPQYQRTTATGFGNIYDVYNTSENYSYSLTAQLQRPFRNGWEAMLAYTYGRAYDVNALRSSQAVSNFRFNPIDENPNDPELRPSDYDTPHRIVGSFTRQFQFLRRAPTDLSFIFVGESGRPYSYTYGSDINGDGSDGNDLVYVPLNAQDIRFASSSTVSPEQSFANLNDFIERVDCLREARGEVIQRNACRQPWSNRLDVRVAQVIPTLRGQNFQITLDILNFGNMLNSRWGRSSFISNQNEVLLRRSGSSVVNQRVLFTSFSPKPDVFNTSDLGSRYQIQLGGRYEF